MDNKDNSANFSQNNITQAYLGAGKHKQIGVNKQGRPTYESRFEKIEEMHAQGGVSSGESDAKEDAP